MLERIADLPDNVLGFVAKGTLTSADYDQVLLPAVDAALAHHPKVRLLYVLGEEFDGLTGGAIWSDARVGVGHATRWERVAVVTDKEWVRQAVSLFGYLMPGEMQGYPTAALPEARAWVVA